LESRSQSRNKQFRLRNTGEEYRDDAGQNTSYCFCSAANCGVPAVPNLFTHFSLNQLTIYSTFLIFQSLVYFFLVPSHYSFLFSLFELGYDGEMKNKGKQELGPMLLGYLQLQRLTVSLPLKSRTLFCWNYPWI
jgi:hypothetical protein